MAIEVTVYRTDKWLQDRKLATGTNVPKTVPVKVDPADLSEPTRRVLLASGGGFYKDLPHLAYDKSYDLTASSYGTHGYENVYVDAEAPTVAEVEAAILKAAERVTAKAKEKKEEDERKEQAKMAKAAEWAALPLDWRASAKGVGFCAPESGPDYRGPLSPSGYRKYSSEDVRMYQPAAYAEADAEHKRLAEIEKEQAEAKELAALEPLRAWVLENGSELARLQLAEGYDCWATTAREDYAEQIGRLVAGDWQRSDEPEGTDGSPKGESRKRPTLAELRGLLAARERLANHAEAAKLAEVDLDLWRVRYFADKEADGGDYEGPQEWVRTELKLAVGWRVGEGQHQYELYYLIPGCDLEPAD